MATPASDRLRDQGAQTPNRGFLVNDGAQGTVARVLRRQSSKQRLGVPVRAQTTLQGLALAQP